MVMEDKRAGNSFVRRWQLQFAAVLLVAFAAFAASPAFAGATVQPSWGSSGGNECTDTWGNVLSYGSCPSQGAEFSIHKEQRLHGEANWTTSKLTGKIGQTVEYKVTVENTGSGALHFTALSDSKCSNLQPSGQTELAAGAKQTFTCEHTLAKGDESPYTNVAAIEGCPKAAEKQGYLCGQGYGKTPNTPCKYKESNKVEVNIEPETPEIAIHKEQRLHGETNYTTATLTGKVGQTVEYKITVENTGNVALHFTALTDAHCTNIAPSGTTELAGGAKETFTCEHTLAKGDGSPYVNVASIEGCSNTAEKEGHTCGLGYGKQPGTSCKFKESNKVEVIVEPESPEFLIHKEQRLHGEAGYTTAKLTGKVGQTVEYKITVENTGNVALHFTALTDAHCSNIAPSGGTELAPGGTESFTCEHTLAKGDESPYVNVASIEGCSKAAEKEGYTCGHGYGKQPGTSCKFKESNKVEVIVEPESPEFLIHKEQRLHGEAGYTTAKLTGKVGQTVEYKITVENTGNVALHFTALTDAHCSNIAPSGGTELAPGGKESFTCEHTLAKGDESPYVNVAAIEGCSKTPAAEKEGYSCGHGYGKTPGTPCKFKESNKVEVGLEPEEPNFTIIKKQRIGSSGSYTTEKLSAEVGQTVDYQITVENTGNVAIKFGSLSDAKCTNIQPAGSTELAVGGKEAFTCEHTLVSGDKPEYTNVAAIEGGGKEKPSNKVVVEVQEPNFSIEKLQRISGSFTKERLRGEIGNVVQYEIIVKNTGNVKLDVEDLTDGNCTNLAGGATEIGVGKSATWTCEHTLTSTGEWTNVATVEANEREKPSNEVVVEVPASPSFTIEKLQEIHGTGAGFTKAPLTGKIGQTVDYEIIVTNTGNVSLGLSALTDANCTNIAGGASSLAVGKSATFTCEHVLAAVGTWTNEGSITGTPPGGTGVNHTSNQVVVNVPAESSFTLEKKQKLAGEFTTAELAGKVGETVHYEIIVTNTGNVPLKVNNVIDANCTGMSGGASEIGVGGSAIFTCEHTLTTVGPYVNEATVVGNEKPQTSNKVVVQVTAPAQQVKAQCAINESAIVLKGGTGSKRGPFTVHITSLGIKQITFLLDGKRIKTLKSSQATGGQFSLRIDPSKLHYGAHTLTVRTVMTDAACSPLARAAVFVRPHTPVVTPKFTG